MSQMIIPRLLCLAAGYLFGLFNTAIVIGKITGNDIRKQGSGNAGTTNMLRVMGPVYGLLVLLGDALKAVIPMLVMHHVLNGANSPYADSFSMPYLIKLYTGLGAILGHDYPFYTKFKGGKGIATGLGVAFALDWRLGLIGVFCFWLPFVLTHYVSLCSLIMTTIMFGIVFADACFTASASADLSEFMVTGLIETGVICVLIIFLAIFRHRTNLSKLVKGQERKTYIFKKNVV